LHEIGKPSLSHLSAAGRALAGVAEWHAVYTTCRHEKRIAEHLVSRDIEHYLPLYTAERKWRDGSRVKLALPLFPCYLFVHVERCARRRVLEVPGVLSLLGGLGGEPAPLESGLIEALRTGVAEGRVEPHPLLTVGQNVRIRDGVFSGMAGVIVRKKAGLRVVLTLDLIQQSVAVEVSAVEIEAIENRSAGQFAA
jgi:transcription antitermination factor NusG